MVVVILVALFKLLIVLAVLWGIDMLATRLIPTLADIVHIVIVVLAVACAALVLISVIEGVNLDAVLR